VADSRADALNGPGKVRVMIVDDHAAYREGLADLLRASDIEVVGAVPSTEIAVETLAEAAPDVVILDLNLPGISAPEATKRVRDATLRSRVLLLSVAAQDTDLSDAILAGASGYLPKDRPVEEIIDWIHAVAADEPPISPQIARALLPRLRDGDTDDAEVGGDLSVGELEILELLADGRGIEDVSHWLGIAPRGMGMITGSILRKVQRR
jgi:DNA-binding NarL/FixJ family response regulator